MLFNSYAFVFLFFPLCLLGFYMAKKLEKAVYMKAFLIVMSLWFLGFSKPANIPVLLISMVVNYVIYKQMKKGQRKKVILAAGIFLNLLALFCFKYTGMTFVPLGVSFYTFTQIAFLMETYRGNLSHMSVWDYGVYITFFPKMIQGPIALPDEINGQIRRILLTSYDWEKGYRSFALFIMGLSKKVLLADTLGKAVEYGYGSLAALSTGDAWILMLSYTLQLYFDFSGYCDMAMGAAGMLGFSLPINFNSPYKAANILEFWKSWHMTLTRFFTKYLYIPLGGNRKGRLRTYVNTFLVFLVSGIWHGAGITFVIWGVLHGILYVITRWRQDVTGVREKGKIKHALSVLCTFFYVNIAWIFFRAPSVQDALLVLKKLISFDIERINRDFAGCFQLDEFWYVIKVLGLDRFSYAHYILMVLMLVVSLLIVFFAKTAVQVSGEMKPSVKNTVILSVLLVWCVLSFSNVSSFLYVNF